MSPTRCPSPLLLFIVRLHGIPYSIRIQSGFRRFIGIVSRFLTDFPVLKLLLRINLTHSVPFGLQSRYRVSTSRMHSLIQFADKTLGLLKRPGFTRFPNPYCALYNDCYTPITKPKKGGCDNGELHLEEGEVHGPRLLGLESLYLWGCMTGWFISPTEIIPWKWFERIHEET